MKVRNSLILLSTFLCVGCVREQMTDPGNGLKTFDCFSASMEGPIGTKVHLEDDYVLRWDKGDGIQVFSDIEGTSGYYYNEGRFYTDSPVSGQRFYAYYPSYTLPPVFNPEDRNTLSFITVYPCAGTTLRIPKMPMVAKMEEDGILHFKHTMGLLRFSFSGTSSIKYIVLSGNNGEFVSGPGTVNIEVSQPVFHLDESQACQSIAYQPVEPYTLRTDEEWNVFFPVPPMVFTQGLHLDIILDENGEVRRIQKSTDQEISVQRAAIKSFSVVDTEELVAEADARLAVERNALTAFYNAMNGPNWQNSTNWCSDKPLEDWQGVRTDEYGHVRAIELGHQGLTGDFKQALIALADLKNLDVLVLPHNPISSSIPPEIAQLTNLWMLNLSECDLTGTIPEEIGSLENLQRLYLQYNKELTGAIPRTIGNLSNAEYICLNDCNLTGSIPEEITHLHKLREPFKCSGNDLLEGTIPSAFKDWEYWNDYWAYIVGAGETGVGNKLEFGDALPHCPDFSVTLVDGTVMTSEMVKNNNLTILFQWATWCGFSMQFLPLLKSAYRHFKIDGLEVLSWATEDETDSEIMTFIENNGINWPTFIAKSDKPDSGERGNYIRSKVLPFSDQRFYYPVNSYPSVTAFNSSGELVYSNANCNWKDTFVPFIASWFDENWTGEDEHLYESSDYSRDGHVTLLQEATEGQGINIIIMGDAFSDKLIADGTYQAEVERAMEAFFSHQPYKSLRRYFNVYSVDAVSKNDYVMGDTALSTNWFTKETNYLVGDAGKVFNYALKAIDEDAMDDAVIIVLMNIKGDIGGTCHMFDCPGGDYGRGVTISYVSTDPNTKNFNNTLTHEAGGHGFAKLGDEYAFSLGTTIPQNRIEYYQDGAQYGWWKNLDFTNNNQLVKWAPFIGDNRFASEGIGIYEGGATYGKGVYRPTKNSIMASSVDYFNAPSRYAIWYRVNKLAYGEEWNGSYEDFVEYDMANQATISQSSRTEAKHRSMIEKKDPVMAPPVIVHSSWQDLL